MPFTEGNNLWRLKKKFKHSQESKEKIRTARARQVITDAHRKAISEGMKGGNRTSFKKGFTPWNKGLPKEKSHLFGRKMSDVQKRKIGDAQKGDKNHGWKGGLLEKNCVVCKVIFKVARKKVNDIFSCSSECKGKRRSGINHPLWKGGITPLVRKIRNCQEYKTWRNACYKRDDYICHLCGDRGNRICVDHFPASFSDILEKNKIKSMTDALGCLELWDMGNGRTLCNKCHLQTENYGGKKRRI